MDQERRSQREMMQENEKQARTTYTNAQAKAAMPRRDNKASKLRVELTDPRKSNYFYEEALKTLRTNIQFAGADIKTILVTSCFPNEGKEVRTNEEETDQPGYAGNSICNAGCRCIRCK